jgi:hypothetical protein
MWDEFQKIVKQNEVVLSSNQRFATQPRPTRFDQLRFTIRKFTYTPVILLGDEHYFGQSVDITSRIGCFLQVPAGTAPFTELVEAAMVRDSFTETQLEKLSIMGFLWETDTSPRGFVSPEHAVQLAKTIEEPHTGRTAPPTGGNGSDLPPTSGKLENGLWHHIPTGTEFPIIDDQYPRETVADAPILALGNNLHRVLAVSADTDTWYEDYPPPAVPRNPQMNNAYVRSLRSYLKKMAIQLIERDNWFLLWHGFLYSNRRGTDFSRIVNNSTILRRKDFINWADEETITEVDANNASHVTATFRWGDLKTAKNHRTVGSGGGDSQYAGFYAIFSTTGRDLKNAFPKVFGGRGPTMDSTLTGDLLHALVEGRLDESLTYNQMLTATAQYWQSRLKTVRNVHTKPPGLVMLKDGTVDLSFDFVSVPSTEGRPHAGYVKFVPERGQPNLIDKLKDFLGRIGQQVKRFIGKKVPPRALKGSDLRKMLCEVSCDCKDFKYRMSYANVKQGVTSQAGRTDNGRAPVKTNPARRPGFCKHILATLRYLTDDAEIQISKDLSAQQQEALKKDRAQFYKEAAVSYEKMKAPAAKGAEEIEPEEEPPPSPEFAKLPAPPKPEPSLVPPVAPVPAPPPTPNYQSTQG